MTSENGITYLRASGINLFFDCGAKFMFQEVHKIEVPNKIPLAFGSATHSTLMRNYTQKIESRSDLDVETVKEIFSDEFEKEFNYVDPNDIKVASKNIKDVGIQLVEKYQREVAPRIYPVNVEMRLRMRFKDYPFGLTGQIDVFDIYNTLVDHKTTGKKIKDVNPENYERQVGGFYVLLLRGAGKEVKRARIDYLGYSDEAIDIRHREVNIDTNHAIKMFKTAADSIKAGNFIPNRNSFLCTKRFCKFWNECEKTFGGSVKS